MKDDRIYLLHVRDSILRIREYTAEGRDAFLQDSKTQDAVARNLEIIGEAVKRVSDSTRQQAPEVPWKQVTHAAPKSARDPLVLTAFCPAVTAAIGYDRPEPVTESGRQRLSALPR